MANPIPAQFEERARELWRRIVVSDTKWEDAPAAISSALSLAYEEGRKSGESASADQVLASEVSTGLQPSGQCPLSQVEQAGISQNLTQQDRADEREVIMQWWDHWRKAIAEGDKSSRPRDWFEAVLDRFDEEISELIAERDHHLSRSAWQHIETAPKDRMILVYAPAREGLDDLRGVCIWHPDAGFCIDELRCVTHWMPLPKAPLTQSQIEEKRSDDEVSATRQEVSLTHSKIIEPKSISELEKILNSEDDRPIKIMPDDSMLNWKITMNNEDIFKEIDQEIIRLRQENAELRKALELNRGALHVAIGSRGWSGQELQALKAANAALTSHPQEQEDVQSTDEASA